MPFVVCPMCQNLYDFLSPAHDQSTLNMMCEPCANMMAIQFKQMAMGDLSDWSKAWLERNR